MFIEGVKFGDSVAIEVRDLLSRGILYYHFGVVLGIRLPKPLQPDQVHTAAELISFVDETYWALCAELRTQQWVLLCSDIEMMTTDNAAKFEDLCESVFGERHPALDPVDPASAVRASVAGKLRPRTWILDTSTGRVFCIKFQFAPPIFRGSAFEGTIAPSSGERCEYHIRHVRLWCGGQPESAQYIRQQLNVWFCTPPSEQCWFRPAKTDAFRVVIDIVDNDDTPIPAVPALAAVPLTGTDASVAVRWTDANRIDSSRVFRLYKTQYPFIYTLMPDDDDRVNTLKAELKGSTGAMQPLVITIPTVESELAIRSAFQRNRMHKYTRWRCASYATSGGGTSWIPVSEEK